MLCCLLGVGAGSRLVARDVQRFRLLEHGREPSADHGAGSERPNHARPIFDPDRVSNKRRLGPRGRLREPKAVT